MLMTGTDLKTARKLVGLTQAQLAEAAGLDQSTIHLLEKHEDGLMPAKLPTLLSLMCVLEACGVVFERNSGTAKCSVKFVPETYPT
jgi:DNA-binding XRE family transcriptional regulator